MAAIVRRVNAAGKPIVAVDIPTGLDCDTGEAHDPHGSAPLSPSRSSLPKSASLRQGEHTGRVTVVDIGIDPAWILQQLD